MHPSLRALSLAAAVAAATATATVASIAVAQSGTASAPATPLVVGLPDFTRLVEKVGPAVVSIEAQAGGREARATPDELQQMPEIFRRFFGPGMPTPPGGRGGTSVGTGFLISADGYVLTNHHVVSGADEVKVSLGDRREFTAKVVGSDQESDVALLKVSASGLPALRIGDSAGLKPGQWVVAIGSPFGLEHSVTAGIVSAINRTTGPGQRYVPFIQTDVAINRGNSGGPLLNTSGEVVGINSQIFSNSGGYMGVSFAIPIDVAMNAVQQLKATGRVSRGMLGIGLQGIDADTAKGLGLSDTRGALVSDVQPGSGAAKAGVQRMDVIRGFNGRPVNDAGDLPPLVGALPPGTRATLRVLRDGRERDIPVVLGELRAEVADAAPPATGGARAATHANPLGIVGRELDAASRRELGLDAGEGVAIARIEGLAARQAGLRPGDVILAVGRNGVGDPAALDRALAALPAGQTAMLLVRRGQATQYVAVTPRAE